MAAIGKYVNSVPVLFKRLFRKYKLLHTCRMLPLIGPNMGSSPICDCVCYLPPICEQRDFDRLNFGITNRELVNLTKRRSFFSLASTNRRKEFTGRKLMGFSMEEMFDVINDVNAYKDFLPFCKRSIITMKDGNKMRADLVIGFPPVIESYTSHINFVRPNVIFAESRDATLFDHLVTNWKFGPGLSNNSRSCVVSFYVSFEFKSVLHSHLANMFFNELVNQMENAFYTEATRRYGPASIPTIKLKVVPDSSTPSST